MALDELKERSSTADAAELRLTLGQHLDELRTRLIRIVLLIAGGMTIGAFLVQPTYNIVLERVRSGLPNGLDYKIVWNSVTEPFSFWMKMSLTLGLIITIPFTVAQIWGFVAPGLKEHERKPFQRIVPVSVGLFFVGAFLGWLILPPTIGWFAGIAQSFQGASVFQRPDEIIYFCAKMVLAFGVGFQLPLLVFFLTKFGLISPATLTRYWRHASVGVFVTAAVVTPSGDPFSMLVMAVPLTILFFGSVYAAKLTMKNNPDNDVPELNDLD